MPPTLVPTTQAMPEKADTPSNFTLKLRKHIRCVVAEQGAPGRGQPGLGCSAAR